MIGACSRPTQPPSFPGQNVLMLGLMHRLIMCAGACLIFAARSRHVPKLRRRARAHGHRFVCRTEAAIGAIACVHPMALRVITGATGCAAALSPRTARRLHQGREWSILWRRTGEPIAQPAANLKVVRVNNRLRRAIEAALGSMTLLSPDPATRYEAAQAVFRSRDANALPALETAISKRPSLGSSVLSPRRRRRDRADGSCRGEGQA